MTIMTDVRLVISVPIISVDYYVKEREMLMSNPITILPPHVDSRTDVETSHYWRVIVNSQSLWVEAVTVMTSLILV